MEAMFSVRFVPRLYNEDRLPLRDSPDTAGRRVGDWCEMAANLRGRDPEQLEDFTKQRSEDRD
jgi:hypothetical protein